jgi:hypothetical protein
MRVHPAAAGLILEYLEAAGHTDDDAGAFFGRSAITSVAVGKVSHRTASTNLSKSIPEGLAFRLAPTPSAQRPPRMLSTTRPTLPRCRNGSAMPISLRRSCTTGADLALRTAQPLKLHIKKAI